MGRRFGTGREEQVEKVYLQVRRALAVCDRKVDRLGATLLIEYRRKSRANDD